MELIRLCSTVFLLTVVVACDSDSPTVVTDSVAEEMVISNLETKWSDMFGAKDLDGITALLAQDSVLIIPGTAPIVGANNIRNATQAMFESDDQVSWKSDFAFVAPSGDMAYDYGTAITKRADGTTVKGYYLVVWVKENGEWKVAADMFN